VLSFLIRLFLTAAVVIDRLERRLDDRATRRRMAAEAGQATAEYALVLLGAAAIALLLAAWAAKSGAISRLFDAVVDQLIDKVR
jgi:protein-S-isoprenylcysteine O-methyltransferase Ste14